MFTDRRDYLLDMIQQMMERIVALLARAKGDPGAFEDLEQDCERAMDDEFAELDRRMQPLEPRMVAHLVRPTERLRAYALLLSARALLRSKQTEAEPVEVEANARRALSLVLEATLLQEEPTSHELDAVRALFPLVEEERLGARYLAALVALAPSSPE